MPDEQLQGDSHQKHPVSKQQHCGLAFDAALLGMTSAERNLEIAASDDGACRWVLRHRLDGRFDYTEHRFVDLRPDGQVEGYWKRSYTSGIFETSRAARDDALEAIAWLPGQL